MGFFITPVFAQEITNPSLIIDSIEVPAEKFNVVYEIRQLYHLMLFMLLVGK